MPELLKALDSVISMNIDDEPTRVELRRNIAKAVDNYHNLDKSLVRIESRFTAAEERFAQKMSDIAQALQNLTILGQDIVELRSNQKKALEEHCQFKAEEDKHQQSINQIKLQLQKYETTIKVLIGLVSFLSAIGIPIFISMIKHIFSLP